MTNAVRPALILFAHPKPHRSRVNLRLLEAVRDLPGVQVNDLYEHYPDFYIRPKPEQERLRDAELIVLQHPLYWYSAPGILKHWQDVVLERGFAYGKGSYALEGKRVWSVITTGHSRKAYCAEGEDRYTMEQLLRPFERMARHCKMEYLQPLVVYGAHRLSTEEIDAAAAEYRERLQGLQALEGVDG